MEEGVVGRLAAEGRATRHPGPARFLERDRAILAPGDRMHPVVCCLLLAPDVQAVAVTRAFADDDTRRLVAEAS